ncbi:MAG: cyclic nucleotide-binding domain-containing protein [Candidatus Promineofilum sp.]|nr:cyclic nucleotide-binding domain-containing protein [Promineifilum sp.]
MANFEFLRKVPLFAEMSDSDLESMCLIVQELHLRAGEVLFEEGSAGDTAYIVERGEVDIVKTSDNREILLAKRSEGEVFGEMALLLDQPRSAAVRARTDTDLIGISRADLRNLLQISPTAASSMFDILVTRLQNTYALLRQSEKMAQLGTFTAGIAHELNNPAAAVQRSADHLSKTLFESAHTFMRLVREGLTLPQQEALERYVRRAQEQAKTLPMNALARSDREAELEEWLEDHGVDNAWECATALVNLGFTDEQLEELAGEYTPGQLPTILDWLNNNYTLFNLLGELQQGASRISSIIKALKSYTYLDQAPITRTDVHQGLDDTLIILRHKLKNEVTVQREYAPDLPLIEAYGSELNQVWTNLIDNAADALRAGATPNPTITLRTRREGGWIIITVEDNGPGIAPENMPHIFETFFTTKPIGQGTGLGLDISYNIVARRHKGDIRVHSEPGRTQFDVWLPVELKED